MNTSPSALAGKNILITGGAGVIGRELVVLLKKIGAKIRVVDLQKQPNDFGDIDYHQLDLSNPCSQFLFRFEPDYVFHLAADFERSEEDISFWENNFSNNILASHYLIREVVKHKSLKKIIFASSYLVYDKKNYGDNSKNNLLIESSSLDPRNICGVAKLQTEKDIEFFYQKMDKQFDYVCARIFRVYGKGSRDVISRWVRSAFDGQTVEVFDKENSFDYIYAEDVALGLLKMAEAEKAKGIVNLASGSAIKISEVLSTLQKFFPKISIKNIKKIIYHESSCADLAKLKKMLSWSPQTTLTKGIKKIITYEKKARNF